MELIFPIHFERCDVQDLDDLEALMFLAIAELQRQRVRQGFATYPASQARQLRRAQHLLSQIDTERTRR